MSLYDEHQHCKYIRVEVRPEKHERAFYIVAPTGLLVTGQHTQVAGAYHQSHSNSGYSVVKLIGHVQAFQSGIYKR